MAWTTTPLSICGYCTISSSTTSTPIAVISSWNGIYTLSRGRAIRADLQQCALFEFNLCQSNVKEQDIRFISETKHGVREDQPGVHPTVLEEFYGAEDDRDGEWEDIDDLIADEQASDVRHAAIEVPEHYSPFSPETEAIFLNTLEELRTEEYLPDGYGLTPEELDGATYPVRESIHLGRGGKKISVVLPLEMWWPRAVRWAQGLELMTRILIEIES